MENLHLDIRAAYSWQELVVQEWKSGMCKRAYCIAILISKIGRTLSFSVDSLNKASTTISVVIAYEVTIPTVQAMVRNTSLR